MVVVLVDATYIRGVGYNLERQPLPIPRQAHDVSETPLPDTTPITRKYVREAAVICDRFAPVLRTVMCEVHLFDECGNPFGRDFNLTHEWTIVVQELDNGGQALSPSLIAPTVWLQKGVGRFYFTPVRVGMHRVGVTRLKKPFQSEFQVARDLGANGGGFIVTVHGVVAKAMSHDFGVTNPAVQRMLWLQAKVNAEPRAFGPKTPATTTFEDKQHRFSDPRYAQLPQVVRRPPVQPEAFPAMPDRTPRLDDNAFRFVDVVLPD
jgi:hypothetical protein